MVVMMIPVNCSQCPIVVILINSTGLVELELLSVPVCDPNDNSPIQYTVIFHGCKIDYFQMKICDIFLIFAQNIDREYTLELHQ